MYQNIRLERSLQILTICIDRPKVFNALNEATLQELQHAVQMVHNSPSEIRVVILTGSGEKAFMAGADILEMRDKDRQAGAKFIHLGQSITEQLEQLPQPVIAAVNGYALGGGCEFALACDFILAADTAVFGQPEVALGITPFFGGCYRLQRAVGMARAKELIFTGRKFTAQEAYDLGLVLEVVPQKQLLPRAEKLAEEIIKMSPRAIAQAKRGILQIASLPTREGLEIEAQIGADLFGTPDQKEGMAAFLEKRVPRFPS